MLLFFSPSAYRCPLCMHSVWNMEDHWEQMDQEIAQSPMPPEYQGATVKVRLSGMYRNILNYRKCNTCITLSSLPQIMCNDCQTHCTVPFHVLGMKCSSCGSYNTAQDGGLMQQQQQQTEQNTEDEAETEQHIQPQSPTPH